MWWVMWDGSWTCEKCQPPGVYESTFEFYDRVRKLRAGRTDLEELNELPHIDSLSRTRWSDIKRMANTNRVKSVRPPESDISDDIQYQIVDGEQYVDDKGDRAHNGQHGNIRADENDITEGESNWQEHHKSSSHGEQPQKKRSILNKLKVHLSTMEVKETESGL